MFRHLLIGAVAMFGLADAAIATVEIATTARGLFSNVRAVGQPLTVVGPIASVSGRTAPGYSLTGGVASLSAPVTLGTVSLVTAGLSLTNGVITTAASANGTTPADTSSGSASALVNNLGISLFTSVLGVQTPVLSLTAAQVQSQTSVNLVGQVATLAGQSSFTNLNLAVGGLPILSLGSNAQVAPNFVAYNQNGLTITLNQQSASLFDNTRVLITNAIGISFANYLLGGSTLNGTITVGQSIAEISADTPVPEPATWLQLLAGFVLVGTLARRQRLSAST